MTEVVIFQQRKSIYESISQTQSQPHEPIFGRRSREELAHIWNKAVNKTLRPSFMLSLLGTDPSVTYGANKLDKMEYQNMTPKEADSLRNSRGQKMLRRRNQSM
ncbi:Uncharacterized protein Fot_56429 [Forsythia ovata]|uniref:Uncharacterized protein n=1 Tax=Forsythia ovata TaxID=205694 RepID=A0ABD1NZY9_9LAMI